MKILIEVLAISEPREWGDRCVAFRYTLGTHSVVAEGWLVELVNDDSLHILPEILAQHANLTRPPSTINRWL